MTFFFAILICFWVYIYITWSAVCSCVASRAVTRVSAASASYLAAATVQARIGWASIGVCFLIFFKEFIWIKWISFKIQIIKADSSVKTKAKDVFVGLTNFAYMYCSCCQSNLLGSYSSSCFHWRHRRHRWDTGCWSRRLRLEIKIFKY